MDPVSAAEVVTDEEAKAWKVFIDEMYDGVSYWDILGSLNRTWWFNFCLFKGEALEHQPEIRQPIEASTRIC